MDHYVLYHSEIPDFLTACAAAPCVRRLKGVGMNCGCEYTSFPLFRDLKPYSRFDHSLGVALIVWHFTHDPKQAVAGLLHDVSTPVFAHVVDFLNGDYLVQESTESGTAERIALSEDLQAELRALRLTTEDVCDYHRYPIADNDSPRLSADRLEYTLGNCLNFGLRTEAEVRAFYEDLTVITSEDGQPELAFKTERTALDFTAASLACSEIYVSDADRYAMQMLSELLRFAIARGVLDRSDLYGVESSVIGSLLADAETAARWNAFRAYRSIRRADAPQAEGEWRRIFAKKRCIDPLTVAKGRVGAFDPDMREAIAAFLNSRQDGWICAGTDQNP